MSQINSISEDNIDALILKYMNFGGEQQEMSIYLVGDNILHDIIHIKMAKVFDAVLYDLVSQFLKNGCLQLILVKEVMKTQLNSDIKEDMR